MQHHHHYHHHRLSHRNSFAQCVDLSLLFAAIIVSLPTIDFIFPSISLIVFNITPMITITINVTNIITMFVNRGYRHYYCQNFHVTITTATATATAIILIFIITTHFINFICFVM